MVCYAIIELISHSIQMQSKVAKTLKKKTIIEMTSTGDCTGLYVQLIINPKIMIYQFPRPAAAQGVDA